MIERSGALKQACHLRRRIKKSTPFDIYPRNKTNRWNWRGDLSVRQSFVIRTSINQERNLESLCRLEHQEGLVSGLWEY